MAKLSLSLLLSSLDFFLSTPKYLLNARFRIENYSQRCRHVHTMLIVIVIKVLSRQVTFVSMNKFYFVRIFWRICIDLRYYCRLFDGAYPRFASHELVSILWWGHKEFIVTLEAITRSIIIHFFFFIIYSLVRILFYRSFILGLKLANRFTFSPLLRTLVHWHSCPLLITVQLPQRHVEITHLDKIECWSIMIRS